MDPVPRPPVDAIVVAGGQGRRLGGVDKAALTIGGRTLLDLLLTALDEADHLAETVVVGPATTTAGMPGRARHVSEFPPGSGPVAAIAAGLGALATDDRTPSPWTLVLAVDQPRAGAVVPALVMSAIDQTVGYAAASAVTVVAPRDGHGRWQWLLAAYRTADLKTALDALPTVINASMRDVFSVMRVGQVSLDLGLLGDIDTPADLTRWRAQAPTAPPP